MPIIKKPSDHFDVVTYTGDGASTKTITGLNFQPDFVWIKRRDGSSDHNIQDSLRGFSSTTKLSSSSSYGENVVDGLYTDPKWGYVSAATSNGFTVTKNTNGDHVNVNGSPYVAWCWKASNASAVTNNDGTLTSQVKANQTAGFSIVTYTGTGSNVTVGHGLGVAPKIILNKTRTSNSNWHVQFPSLGNGDIEGLNTNGAYNSGSNWFNSTPPTSSVFSVGSSQGTASCVCYCFTDIEGFSKFGSFTGNGSTTGPFVYTGFKPKFVVVKKHSGLGEWAQYDSIRETFNPNGAGEGRLRLNTSAAAAGADSAQYIDFLSNGFMIRNNSGFDNDSGGGYIYMAFAENPIKYASAK